MSVGTELREALRTRPKPYQVQGVRFLQRALTEFKGALLADDMGLGKTLQTIGFLLLLIKRLRNLDLNRYVVVVVPAPVKLQWADQFLQHAGLKTEVLQGQTPYPVSRKILILNYQVLQHWEEELRALNPVVLVFDECHYIKNKSAKCTRAAVRLAKASEHVIALSGTPITNAPVEFWPVFHMIAPKLFHSFHEFAWAYCDPKRGFRGSWDYSGASNLKKLRRVTSPFVLRRLKKDHLRDLPPKRRIVVPVEISNRREYVKARDDFVEWLASKEGVKAVQSAKGALALVRLGKLKQIAAKGKLKVAFQWIDDFLAQTDKKLVIFAVHKEVLQALKERYPAAALVKGGISFKKRHAEVKRFRTSQRCRVILGQLKAMGTGVDGLTVSDTTLTLEFGWNQATHNQAEDRVNRLGQESKRGCENYYLVARDTVEEWLLEVIHKKQVTIDEVLEGKKTEGRVSLLKMLERFK